MPDKPLKNQLLYRLNRWLWGGIVSFIVLLALYISLGRMVMNNVGSYQAELLREINARLDFVVEANSLRGYWESLTPYLELHEVRVAGTAHAGPILQVQKLSLGFDLLDSILTRSLQLYMLQADVVQLHFEMDADDKLQIESIAAGGGFLSEPVMRFVLNTEQLLVGDLRWSLHRQNRLFRGSGAMHLLREQEFRRLKLSLFDPGAEPWLRLVAETAGDPTGLDDLDADLHLNLRLSAAEGHAELASIAGLAMTRGTVDSESWFSLRQGKLRSIVDFSALDLAVKPLAEAAEPILVDRFSARLQAIQVEQGWEFDATGIQAGSGAAEFVLQGFKGSLQDGALQAHFSTIDVGRLAGFLQAQPWIPAGASQALATLSPEGQLTRMQVIVTDLEQVTGSWSLQTNFEEFAVNSWKAAPSIDNATGYLTLTPGGGLLQINAGDFALGFPKLYQHVLEYRNFATELAFIVEPDRLDLWSGRFTGLGEEGEVHGLFALTLPLPLQQPDASPEIDLLIGVRDTLAKYRDKYLPGTLPPALLQWLGRSIGGGHIEEGGFLFRGRLRKNDKAHRNTQLFLNIDSAEVDYHPDWPPLSEALATLYVDNTELDALVLRARCRDSLAEPVKISLHRGSGRELLLEVNGALHGPAQDGLSVLNDSPLRSFIDDAFVEWKLDGEMTTALQLNLDLRDPGRSARVELTTDFADVVLDTGALGVSVENIQGTLGYRTGSGFYAPNLRARLWGQPLQAQVVQGAAADGLNDLEIRVNGWIESDAILRWLDLDILRLASGGAEAELHIVAPPGRQASLEIKSALQGVALDLPQQFAKAAETPTQLKVEIPLGDASPSLMLSLEDQLWLHLRLGSDGLRAAGLGFARPQLADTRQGLVIGGELERLRWNPWMDFVSEYVLPGRTDFGLGLLLQVRGLKLGELEVLGRMAGNVELSAQQLANAWQLGFSTDWVRGSADIPSGPAEAALNLEYLDLEGLPDSLLHPLEAVAEDAEVADVAEAGEDSFELPDLQVTVQELQKGGRPLGNLSFTAHQDGGNYRLENINGNLRGLILGGDTEFVVDWLREGDTGGTHLRGPIGFRNFGEVMTNFGYEQFVETGNGRFDVEVSWPGGLMDFQLAKAAGRVGVAVEEGRFLKSSAAAEGTLRMVGLLNLAEFVRRLSFDTSSLFKSGISFDSITGELILREGVVEVPLIDVLGRSSRFQFAGSVDVEQALVGGELLATLPVASNLPWVAALIGGLPAAAGVYLVSKVFTEQVDRFSSAVYSISGPWADPEVKFERIFDNSVTHRKALAVSGEATDNEVADKEAAPPAPD